METLNRVFQPTYLPGDTLVKNFMFPLVCLALVAGVASLPVGVVCGFVWQEVFIFFGYILLCISRAGIMKLEGPYTSRDKRASAEAAAILFPSVIWLALTYGVADRIFYLKLIITP